MYEQSLLINLLPHRAMKREAGVRDFGVRVALLGILGVLAVLLGAQVIERFTAEQDARNTFLEVEIKKLEAEIAQIATLQAEIDALKARQKAVEDLQSDRNLPVYLFEELVKQTPEGVYLRAAKQDGLKITLSGSAQTQERVSEYLRNVSVTSTWLENPELQEIKLTPTSFKSNDKAYDFVMVVTLKRERKLALPGQNGLPSAGPNNTQSSSPQTQQSGGAQGSSSTGASAIVPLKAYNGSPAAGPAR